MHCNILLSSSSILVRCSLHYLRISLCFSFPFPFLILAMCGKHKEAYMSVTMFSQYHHRHILRTIAKYTQSVRWQNASEASLNCRQIIYPLLFLRINVRELFYVSCLFRSHTQCRSFFVCLLTVSPSSLLPSGAIEKETSYNCNSQYYCYQKKKKKIEVRDITHTRFLFSVLKKKNIMSRTIGHLAYVMRVNQEHIINSFLFRIVSVAENSRTYYCYRYYCSLSIK